MEEGDPDLALLLAAMDGDADGVAEALRCGANVDCREPLSHSPDRWTALHYAVARGHSVACVRLLLEARPVMDVRSSNGKTPLAKAAEFGALDCLAELLLHGASVLARDDAGRTPLHWAAEHFHLDCARSLISATPIEWRRSLLDAGDSAGDTALHRYARYGDAIGAQLLLDSGANVSLQNKNEETAADVAVDDATRAVLLNGAAAAHEAGAEHSATSRNWSTTQ